MPVPAVLISTAPREKAGARTFARYQYQANVSLAQILDLHAGDADYTAIFDYHDDLVIVEPDGHSSSIKTYQIKGRDGGEWKISALTSVAAKGGSPRSIVGKLFWAVNALGESVRESHFLTNAPFKLTLDDGSTTGSSNVRVACSSLALAARKKISKALDADFPPPRDRDHEGIFFFCRTAVGVHGHADQLRGKLSTFFEAQGEILPVRALHDLLIAEIINRACNDDVHDSEDGLCRHKAITRAEMDGLFDRVRARTATIVEHWATFEADLISAGFGSAAIIKWKNASIRYQQARGRGEAGALTFSDKCHEALAADPSLAASVGSIHELVEQLRALVPHANDLLAASDYDGALAVEAFEAIHEIQ